MVIQRSLHRSFNKKLYSQGGKRSALSEGLSRSQQICFIESATMKNKMSLREFAEKIGASPGTVSKVLTPNPKYRISPQKSVYIQKKAREYGFQVSSETRVMRKQKKDLRVGLVCGSAFSMLGGFLWEGAQEYCLSQGGEELLVDCCEYSLREENKALRRMAGKKLDAIIYWSTCRDAVHRNSQRLFSRANNVAAALPLVYIGESPPAGDRVFASLP